MKSNSLNFKEIYAIADFQPQYVSLFICIYQESQFFVIFNERWPVNFFNDSQKIVIKKCSFLLRQLIKKAEQELNTKIKKVSYNLDSNNIKIQKHFYIHQFSKTVALQQKDMNMVYDGFKTNLRDDLYQIFLSKITNFHLLDQDKMTAFPPLGEVTKSIKLEGLHYKVHRENIAFYLKIFEQAKITPFRPVLLPYAIFIGLFNSLKVKKSAVIIWNENKWQLYYFVNKVFVKQFFFRKSLSYLIEKIHKKFHYKKEDVRKYLFNFLSINKIEKNIFEALGLHNKSLLDKHEEIRVLVDQYFAQVFDEMIFLMKDKMGVNVNDVSFNITGDVMKISNLEEYLKKMYPKLNLKINFQNFVGIKDFRDVFLIGNAYYHHLENKLIYNEKI